MDWLRAAEAGAWHSRRDVVWPPADRADWRIWALGQRALASGVDGKLLDEAKGRPARWRKLRVGLLKPKEDLAAEGNPGASRHVRRDFG